MKRQALNFYRPAELQATAPPEARGLARDEVRLLVSSAEGHTHAHFKDLADFLNPGDLLVVNRSATLPASLPAVGRIGSFTLNLSTHYGAGLWLAEPRWSPAVPGPLPLNRGDRIAIGSLGARLVAPHPGLSRLWFVQMEGDLNSVLFDAGRPIRYGYVEQPYPLSAYQTIFSAIPGSVEMPSAGRPFSQRVLRDLRQKGVEIRGLVLHTGVSSLEIEEETVEEHVLYAEPFKVPQRTADAVNRAHAQGRRVIAVGTTVVRALESAWNEDEDGIRATCGFTRAYIHPGRRVHTVHGLITGLHDPLASHLAMLYAVAGQERVQEGYAEAVQHSYLWHEFGDSHLLLADPTN